MLRAWAKVRRGLRPALGVVMGALAAGDAAAQATPDAEVLVAMALQADAGRGQTAYDACVRCHRRDGWGRINGSVPRLSGQHASVIVKQMIDIRAGRRRSDQMKAYLDESPIDNQTLVDLAAHLQQLPMAPRVGRGPGDQLEQGQALYERRCARCHGAQGEGDAPRWRPMLAAQHFNYVRLELQAILKGERGPSDPAMLQALAGLGEEEMQALADHVSRLPPPTRAPAPREPAAAPPVPSAPR